MSWFVTVLLLLIGLVLIIKGGDMFVDAASWMAEKSGIPKFIIGATVVSLATTLPEMLVSFIAAGEGKVDMAIGNAIGSVTANLGLIMGIALIAMPHVIQRSEYMARSVMMLGAAAIIMIFSLRGPLGLLPNLALLALFVLALYDNIRQARSAIKGSAQPDCEAKGAPGNFSGTVALAQGDNCSTPSAPFANGTGATQTKSDAKSKNDVITNTVKFIVGTIGIVVGAQLLIDNGSQLALLLGVPERIIAVSVIAIGTSLPEMVTTITAIAKKESSLSIGNIIGANIIDLSLILPVCSLISGQALPVSPQAAVVDIPACLFIGCIALVPALVTKKFTRAQGVLLVAAYTVYIIFTSFFLR